ncbi:MAG: glycosyltransferase [Acidobacteria bacterium]|nr:glycosyltransferase [Acidobacteriota bacterium]
MSIGIVVPTLGERPEYLRESLASIRAAGTAHVAIVAPATFDASALLAEGLADEKIDETGRSLPEAINQGIAALASDVEYVGWLGDDDLLRPDAIGIAERELRRRVRVAAVYGRCDYIDAAGTTVWRNSSGRWAAPLLHVGPDLVPQPGSLIRRSAWQAVGGVRTDLGWAFDFDLFLKLSAVGRLHFIPVVLAAFRWHPGSLSVGQRRDSVREASQVRREHLPRWARVISVLWERPVQWATFRASALVERSSR